MRRVAAICATAFVFIVLASPAWADPPGNNGTVKLCVGENCTDFPPQNEPHLPCMFTIEFRGYDEGDLTATWQIDAHAPTGDGRELDSGSVFIGGDPAGGATDLDGTVDVDLTAALQAMADDGFSPNAQQGWHVKLTVHAPGSIGSDVKHKTVWVEDCTTPPSSTPPPTSTTPPPTSTTPPPTSTTPPPTSTTPPPTSPPTSPPHHTSSTQTPPPPHGPQSPPSPPPSPTALTGADVKLPAIAIGVLLVLGAGSFWLRRKFV